jgi:hypothetical protein
MKMIVDGEQLTILKYGIQSLFVKQNGLKKI